jgi:hypothetical protein
LVPTILLIPVISTAYIEKNEGDSNNSADRSPDCHEVSVPVLTLATETKDFRGVPHFAETMFLSHDFGPFLNCSTFNLDSIATTFTDQVMMMRFSAEAINGFSIFAAQYINNLVVHQTL